MSDICQDTDTTQYADVLLPALGWGEKDGTVTNSERRISRQRAFLDAPEASTKRIGGQFHKLRKKWAFQGFDFESSHDIFKEHAQLSAYQNAEIRFSVHATETFRYFNLAGLTNLSLDDYQELEPTQWPVLHLRKMAKPDETLLLNYLKMVSLVTQMVKPSLLQQRPVDPVNPSSSEYPLVLNTGRIRDQWHTMTRTGLSANLSTHKAEPYCEIHPNDALKYGLKDGELVEIKSTWGIVYYVPRSVTISAVDRFLHRFTGVINSHLMHGLAKW